jgi:taurine dioxygenase
LLDEGSLLMPAQCLSVRPLSPAIGALVQGIDLARPLPEATLAALREALLSHQVLFFEGQDFNPVSQRDFAAGFGRLHIHPIYPNVPGTEEIIVLDTSSENLPDNDTWHTDVTFIETPPLGSILAAKLVPPSGGDTTWSSSVAAYEGLSEPFRAFLDELTAVHDITKAFPVERWGADGNEDHWQTARRKNPPVVHPVVRVHPETGKRGLFVNEGFTTRIRELSAAESDTVLRLLFVHIAKPEFTVRWAWKPGDVAFWDNRLTQHYALADYLPHRRVMHRATILGDRPFGPRGVSHPANG